MSRTLAKALLCFSAAMFFFLVILDGSILEGWLRSLTQIVQFISLIGAGSLLKKKLLKSNASLWAMALLVTFLTSIQALVALPLHKVEIHFVSATATAVESEDLEVRLPYQDARLSYDSSKSGVNEWVFASEGRVLKWGEKAEAWSQLEGSQLVDTIPISWSLGSLFKLFSPRVEVKPGLPGEKSRIRITTRPDRTRLRIVYASNIGDTILDTSCVGDVSLYVRAGGRLEIRAQADGHITQSLDLDVDSAMDREISLPPKDATVTIRSFDLAGNEERNAEIWINSQRKNYRPFEAFPLPSNNPCTVFLELTSPEGQKRASEPLILELSPGLDTSVSCTLLPPF